MTTKSVCSSLFATQAASTTAAAAATQSVAVCANDDDNMPNYEMRNHLLDRTIAEGVRNTKNAMCSAGQETSVLRAWMQFMKNAIKDEGLLDKLNEITKKLKPNQWSPRVFALYSMAYDMKTAAYIGAHGIGFKLLAKYVNPHNSRFISPEFKEPLAKLDKSIVLSIMRSIVNPQYYKQEYEQISAELMQYMCPRVKRARKNPAAPVDGVGNADNTGTGGDHTGDDSAGDGNDDTAGVVDHTDDDSAGDVTPSKPTRRTRQRSRASSGRAFPFAHGTKDRAVCTILGKVFPKQVRTCTKPGCTVTHIPDSTKRYLRLSGVHRDYGILNWRCDKHNDNYRDGQCVICFCELGAPESASLTTYSHRFGDGMLMARFCGSCWNQEYVQRQYTLLKAALQQTNRTEFLPAVSSSSSSGVLPVSSIANPPLVNAPTLMAISAPVPAVVAPTPMVISDRVVAPAVAALRVTHDVAPAIASTDLRVAIADAAPRVTRDADAALRVTRDAATHAVARPNQQKKRNSDAISTDVNVPELTTSTPIKTSVTSTPKPTLKPAAAAAAAAAAVDETIDDISMFW